MTGICESYTVTLTSDTHAAMCIFP